MSNELSAPDMERVSAYLDNQLSLGEKAIFEQRLKNEPYLSRVLVELKATRTLLRLAPQRRAPRSFVIQRHMVPESPNRFFTGWSTLNLVSAAATFLLVLVFVGDIWANGLPLVSLGAPAPEEAPQVLMAQEAATEEPAAADTGLAATPTLLPTEGDGEIERFAVPEHELEQKASNAFDPRLFLTENARSLEYVLVTVAILAGLFAWWRRRNS